MVLHARDRFRREERAADFSKNSRRPGLRTTASFATSTTTAAPARAASEAFARDRVDAGRRGGGDDFMAELAEIGDTLLPMKTAAAPPTTFMLLTD